VLVNVNDVKFVVSSELDSHLLPNLWEEGVRTALGDLGKNLLNAKRLLLAVD